MRATILNRLRQLEKIVKPGEKSPILVMVEQIRESQRLRLEKLGLPPEEPLKVDFTGCRGIAEAMMRARAARLQMQKFGADSGCGKAELKNE